MIDLQAPIIPGSGAAGFRIGAQIQDALVSAGVSFQVEFLGDGIQAYRSSSVDLWVRGGVIEQIGVHGQYGGKLLDVLGIGSSVEEIRSRLGPVALDEEDTLVVEGVPGFSFEIDVESSPSRVTEVFVFSENPPPVD